jgi:dCTP deaminase
MYPKQESKVEQELNVPVTLTSGQVTVAAGLLVDHEIRKLALEQGMIAPFEEGEHRPGIISYGLSSIGYDCRLSGKFKIFTNLWGGVLDPKRYEPQAFVEYDATYSGYCQIPPNSYALGETMEIFNIPRNIGVVCYGKSTYARNGIIVNVTPGEPEWEGRWTVSISNSSPSPAKVYAGEGIMQCLFFRTAAVCETSYKDKKGIYQGDQGLRHATVVREVLEPQNMDCPACKKVTMFSPRCSGHLKFHMVCNVCGYDYPVKDQIEERR